ncbi:MAG TPA: hypothetical protein VFF24_03225, partial [Acidimicrobiia bacterium]|nr:hypothetical protein [Acidimicrobiia bacterium]
MRPIRFLAPAAAILLAAAGEAQADGKAVLVPGDPPLTEDMAADYCKLAEWRFGPLLAKAGGTGRLRELLINDWKNGDARRQQTVLADLKWWREDYPKLSPAERDRLVAHAPPAGPSPRDAEAIHRLKLQQWNDARHAQIRAIS